MGVKEDFRQELYDLLNDNVPLMAVVKAIVDVKPQATDSGDPALGPWVQFGRMDFLEDSTATESGFDVFIRLHIWSTSLGEKETLAVQDLIYAALHRKDASMTVTGYSVLLLDRVGSDVEERDAQGWFHGVDEYRAVVHNDSAD